MSNNDKTVPDDVRGLVHSRTSGFDGQISESLMKGVRLAMCGAIMADRANASRPVQGVPARWSDDQKETVRCIIVDAMNSAITEEWEVADFHMKRILSALATTAPQPEAPAVDLMAENERLRAVMLQSADILHLNLGRQDEKVRDVEPLLRAALAAGERK